MASPQPACSLNPDHVINERVAADTTRLLASLDDSRKALLESWYGENVSTMCADCFNSVTAELNKVVARQSTTPD